MQCSIVSYSTVQYSVSIVQQYSNTASNFRKQNASRCLVFNLLTMQKRIEKILEKIWTSKKERRGGYYFSLYLGQLGLLSEEEVPTSALVQLFSGDRLVDGLYILCYSGHTQPGRLTIIVLKCIQMRNKMKDKTVDFSLEIMQNDLFKGYGANKYDGALRPKQFECTHRFPFKKVDSFLCR